MDFPTDYTYRFFSEVYRLNVGRDNLSPAEKYRLWFLTGAHVMACHTWMGNQRDVSPHVMAEQTLPLSPEMCYTFHPRRFT